MAASGSPYDGPNACPFVALELDRDRRSERPDYRHRCFAEPTPAPRAIAHQEAYCLSPGFSACPIFQDWAVRAAARPVGTAAPEGHAGVAAAGAAAAGAAAFAVTDDGAPETVQPPIEDELPPMAAVQPEPGVEPEPHFHSAPEPAWAEVGDDDPQQLGAFDDPAVQSSLPGALTAPEPASGTDWDAAAERYAQPPEAADAPGYVPPPARRDAPPEQDSVPEYAAVPGFLAGRAAAQPPEPAGPAPSAELPPPRPTPRVSREEILPSWEIDGRYGAGAPEDDRGGGRLDSLLTAIAVLVILGLGIAGVLFLPGLLAGTPDQGTRPSVPVLVSPGPTEAPTFSASEAPTVAPRTTAPTQPPPTASVGPVASPRLYRIKTGDTLAKIARRFKITVQELLDANPQIENPDHIMVGFVLEIPPPSGE